MEQEESGREGTQLIKKKAISRRLEGPKKSKRLGILMASTSACGTNQALQRLQGTLCISSLSYPANWSEKWRDSATLTLSDEDIWMQRVCNLPGMPLPEWLKNGRRKEEKWIPGLPNLSLFYKRFARKAETKSSERAMRSQTRKERKDTDLSGKER